MVSPNPTRVFLTAEWRDLALLNYVVDPELLQPFVPTGTELDAWAGKYFVSLVGFRFLNTKVMGVRLPFHCNFDEVNLRFYVRRDWNGESRRGVVFIREIVPRRAIALVARIFYNEKYVALPMRHEVLRRDDGTDVTYGWRSRSGDNSFALAANGVPQLPKEGSEAHFITEHFWGYSAQPGARCIEYRVEHASWAVWTAHNARFEGNAMDLYGADFSAILKNEPASAFLAVGSPVTVYNGARI
jgi:uncharacterized protein